jgi:hypothetical protein
LLLRIDEPLLSGLQIEHITPLPSEARPTGSAVVYVFPLQGSPEQVTVTFNVKPDGIGPATGRIGVVDGPDVDLTHFTYP